MTAYDELPPTDGLSYTPAGHLLIVHLGAPLPIRQRREDLSHKWRVTRGDLSLTPAGWRTLCWTERPATFLRVELEAGLVNAAADEAAGRDVDLPCLFSFDDPVCRELPLSMLQEAETHGSAARLYVESAAVVLAHRLARIANRTVAPAPRGGLPLPVLRRAKDYLQSELSRNPGVAELAAAVGMGAHHFSRMFKRSTGMAPHQYLCDIRLDRSKALLAAKEAPIIEIALEVGFSNPSQFSAFFRKRTGLSPSEFRRGAR